MLLDEFRNDVTPRSLLMVGQEIGVSIAAPPGGKVHPLDVDGGMEESFDDVASVGGFSTGALSARSGGTDDGRGDDDDSRDAGSRAAGASAPTAASAAAAEGDRWDRQRAVVHDELSAPIALPPGVTGRPDLPTAAQASQEGLLSQYVDIVLSETETTTVLALPSLLVPSGPAEDAVVAESEAYAALGQSISKGGDAYATRHAQTSAPAKKNKGALARPPRTAEAGCQVTAWAMAEEARLGAEGEAWADRGGGDVAADREPVEDGGVGEAHERDRPDLSTLASEAEVEAVGALDDRLGREVEDLGAAEPAEAHQREGGAAAGRREQSAERDLLGPSGLGLHERPVGLVHVAAEQREDALVLLVGEHLVGLAAAVEAGEVEGVEGVGRDELDAAQEAVEAPARRDPAADRPGRVPGGQPGEVERGVSPHDVVVRPAAARQEGAEVAEVGPVRLLGVGAPRLGVPGPGDEELDGLGERRSRRDDGRRPRAGGDIGSGGGRDRTARRRGDGECHGDRRRFPRAVVARDSRSPSRQALSRRPGRTGREPGSVKRPRPARSLYPPNASRAHRPASAITGSFTPKRAPTLSGE